MTNTKNPSNGSTLAISNSTLEKVNDVFKLFDKLFQDYSPDEVFVSFNGGKDCTVVLSLLSEYMKQQKNLSDCVIPVLYIRPESPFQEVEDFVAKCKITYRVDMIQKQGSIKPILESICAERANLKAVVMGLRRTDPHGKYLKPMQQTDPGWPPLLRVNPILEWSCQDIWTYILEKKVPYCSLYDLGYTSLGDTTNTQKNPNLRIEDPITGEVTYRPAYELLDDSVERDGRR